jgi:hypothetical protein
MLSTRTRSLWRSIVAAVIVATIGAGATFAKDDNPHHARPFTIGVIGDMPYTSQQLTASRASSTR